MIASRTDDMVEACHHPRLRDAPSAHAGQPCAQPEGREPFARI
jgi:hypothetical protein